MYNIEPFYVLETTHGPTDRLGRWRWRSHDRRPVNTHDEQPGTGRPGWSGNTERQWSTNRCTRRTPKHWSNRTLRFSGQSTVATASVTSTSMHFLT